ncbi:MAG: peptide transporter, partial [Deltaproteobacteria bacterium]
AAALRFGSEIGVLSVGAGLLIGLRVTFSMLIGSVLAWVVAPDPLFKAGLVPALTFNMVLQRWIMWPATGLMVAGGLAALMLKWKVIAKSFHGLGAKDVDQGGDFPIKWVLWGAIACTIVLAAVQKISLGFPIWLSLVSVVLSLVLMLVG